MSGFGRCFNKAQLMMDSKTNFNSDIKVYILVLHLSTSWKFQSNYIDIGIVSYNRHYMKFYRKTKEVYA